MECISYPLIDIGYANLQIKDRDLGVPLWIEVEGDFYITLEQKLIFSEKYILLLELAISMHLWLNEMKEFYYTSIDYQDEPILLFSKQKDGSWEISGIWMENCYKNIDEVSLRSACSSFVKKVFFEVTKHGHDIEKIVQNFKEGE